MQGFGLFRRIFDTKHEVHRVAGKEQLQAKEADPAVLTELVHHHCLALQALAALVINDFTKGKPALSNTLFHALANID